LPPRDHQGALWPMEEREEKSYVVHRRHGHASISRACFCFLRSFWAAGAVIGHDGLSAACWPLQLAHLMVLPLEWCPVVRISAEPAPWCIFAPLCPVQSPASPTLTRPYPSGDWVFNFQTSAHEHNRPGGVFQSFCPEGQPDRLLSGTLLVHWPSTQFLGTRRRHQLLLGGRLAQ